MKYASVGSSTFGPEVTDISAFGIWILYRGREYFLAYEDFPWFLHAPIQKIFAVVEEGPGHLRWPELDVDLALDSIRRLGEFPLVYEPGGTFRSADGESGE